MRPAKIVVTLGLIAVAVLLLVLAIGFTISTLRQPDATFVEQDSSFIERMGPDATPEELVAETVREIRAETAFPVPEDEYSDWVGVEGRGRVLVYQYEAFNTDHLDIAGTRQRVNDYAASMMCEGAEFRYMLRAGVEVILEYHEGATEVLSLSVTERDCQSLGL